MLQPVPTFGAEGNYFSCQKAKRGLRREDRCIPGPAVLADGTDVTEAATVALSRKQERQRCRSC